jgi:cyclohexadieny/prephenate dehydrogenase
VSRPFGRVAVIGLGLIGGSVAAGARARGIARTVVGVTRGRESAALARQRGIVDEVTSDPSAGVRDAELVVLATPVHAMARMLAAAAPGLGPGALVTDAGSVKGALAETLPGLLPPGVHYVGAHPMAGSHESGLAHARADLLAGAACVITPGPGTPAAATSRVAAFWRALGARILERDPQAHDREVAWVSHAPHAVAFAFARALAEAPASAADLRASGFRDFTRIAASDPELWADILVQNRKAVAGPLLSVSQQLGALLRLLEAGDLEGLQAFFSTAREALGRGAAHAPSGGANPEIPAAPRAASKESKQEA